MDKRWPCPHFYCVYCLLSVLQLPPPDNTTMGLVCAARCRHCLGPPSFFSSRLTGTLFPAPVRISPPWWSKCVDSFWEKLGHELKKSTACFTVTVHKSMEAIDQINWLSGITKMNVFFWSSWKSDQCFQIFLAAFLGRKAHIKFLLNSLN